MLAKKNGQRLEFDEPEAGNGNPGGDAHPDQLVWERINNWVHVSEGGRYRLERFVTGEHDRFTDDFVWPERYRILKCNDYWCFEFAPTEESFDTARRCCEADAVRA